VALSVLGLVAAYVIGAVPVGVLVARLAGGVDIRRHGSGNIGATNVLRTLGPAAGVITLLGDIVKGYAAVWVAGTLGGTPGWVGAGAAAAVVGNCWPVFLRFRGGKGVATGLGAFLAAAPWAVAPAAVVFAALAAATRLVSLASITACAALAVAAWVAYPPPIALAATVVATIIIVRHRANIQRLRAGTESRLGARARAA
jgi:glycerol-3-phosphate acyltransferase PlsY